MRDRGVRTVDGRENNQTLWGWAAPTAAAGAGAAGACWPSRLRRLRGNWDVSMCMPGATGSRGAGSRQAHVAGLGTPTLLCLPSPTSLCPVATTTPDPMRMQAGALIR